MDKTFLMAQLGTHLLAGVQEAHRAASEAKQDAASGANRAVNLARGLQQRKTLATAQLDALGEFRPQSLRRGEAIRVGAVVEVEGEEGNGRTLFIAPVGAGLELAGPGGDGIFHVVTPGSPFGRALVGKKVGDTVEVTIQGEPTDWTITHAD
ncbi:MAG: GreA/GreB family elongation factor [Deltaproteobacteria bacterium]|nr:GreA/GreB family elongation factor [Deltaproteobacteria bacterium]